MRGSAPQNVASQRKISFILFCCKFALSQGALRCLVDDPGLRPQPLLKVAFLPLVQTFKLNGVRRKMYNLILLIVVKSKMPLASERSLLPEEALGIGKAERATEN